ncbi:MAG: hypothetical protein AAGF11_17410 [Myxococcota bacterium]
MATPHRFPFGVLLALLAGLYACRSREGDRCSCAEDCRDDLVCVAEGRVLDDGECTPVVGENVTPGVCVDADEAAEDDGGGGLPQMLMDLGSKRDFDPGLPPAVGTETETETGTSTGTGTNTGTGTSTETGTSTGTGPETGTSTSPTSTGPTSTGPTSTGAGSSSAGSGSSSTGIASN